MASALNRTTRQFVTSVNTPDFPVGQWIINPDMSAVTGFGSQYWIITGDVVTLMDSAARSAVDATQLTANRDAAAAALDLVEDVLRAVVLELRDELNNHALKINSILDAVDAATSLADLKSRVASIADYPQRTVQQLRDAVRGKLGS